MDLGKKKPVPKAEGVKIVNFSPVVMPGNMVGQLSLTIYGLGDDEKIYLLEADKSTWVEF